ncbi:MAG: hypothetical protein V1787_01755 [Candidatus Micrarchaeota archaeon]
MPLTPLHWGALAFGLLLPAVFYLPALALSSVAGDAEGLWGLLTGQPLHAFLHTYLGAGIMALAIAAALVLARRPVDRFMRRLGFAQEKTGNRGIVGTSLFAAWLHVFSDSFLYADMTPLAPFSQANPMLGMAPGAPIAEVYAAGIVGSIVLVFFQLWRNSWKSGL